jgi:hypothetical protein
MLFGPAAVVGTMGWVLLLVGTAALQARYTRVPWNEQPALRMRACGGTPPMFAAATRGAAALARVRLRV